MKRNGKYGLLSLAFIASIISCTDKNKTGDEVDEKPLVRIEKVTSQDVPQSQDFTANVQANVVNNISPSVQMRIKDIKVEIGDRVNKGQVLVLLDKTSLIQQKTQLDNLQLEYDRLEELFKVGGASKQAVDQMKTQLDVARSSYENLSENTQLISPITGVVTARNYDNGDMYGGNPILTIEQITPVKLLVHVSESFYTKVKKGMDVKVKLDVFGDQEFIGKVSLIYPTIDPATRTFPVEVKLANTDGKVRPGMFARATMDFGVKKHVVTPDLSVIKQSGSGDRYIYVYKDGKVTYNKVELGRQIGNKYEVISGISDGDEVVVAGQSRLTNGMEVEVEKDSAEK
ncbi:efflux RND transporter periplasmic adaptor subunit [Coprobacter tertius]|uniref:Efflux RND transporter periplasmic adaptor subunit n=1 Tax=Coprobacter tertius TaxID=2944915 RepID=A0ABT1MGA3_9BACT|nr:efflux RND transporter periplasmic adaptor subunit [Coprobacter tertius]MCP9611665.1 efflux RND transporter periplasmic adaptor subunit [Coprobacter tertius]